VSVLTVKEVGPETRDIWHEIVASAGGHIFQTFHWAEVEERMGAKPVPFIVDDRVVMMSYQHPVFSARRFGFVRDKLTIPRGPIFKGGTFDAGQFRRILGDLNEYAVRNRVAVCDLFPFFTFGSAEPRTELENCGFRPIFDSSAFSTQTYVLDCGKPLDQLLAAMEKRTRWSIRKAEKENLVVKEGTDESAVATFYSLHRKAVPRPLPEEFFRVVFGVLGRKCMAKIFFTMVGHEAVSTAFLLLFGKKMFYVWGGSDSSYRQLCPGELLHWRVIQWGKRNGYLSYDFHGAQVEDSDLYRPSKKAETVTLFKRGFGGEFVRYLPEYRKIYSRFGFHVLGGLGKISSRMRQLNFDFAARPH